MHLIALGANLPSPEGAPRETLQAALHRLAAMGLRVAARSAWYRTPAFPPGAGAAFVNGAAALEAAMEPAELLAALHEVERGFGRSRDLRWAPRSCDLDLIASDARVLPDPATARRWIGLALADQRRAGPPGLILPHPRVQDRAFVLRPLLDIAPDWVHPLLGRTVREMLDDLPAAARAGIVAL